MVYGEKVNPLASSFGSPRDRDIPGRKMVNRMYGSCTGPVIMRYNDTIDHERHVRCRSCAGCLRARRFLWQMRAEYETLMADRTWFFTGTFRKQSHHYEEVAQDVTLFLKRLRARCHEKGTNYRYLILPERHKSGAIHFHALIHSDSRCTYRMVVDSWGYGFTVAKLANYKSAGYVCKYATKDLFADSNERRPRIRASRKRWLGSKLQEGFEGPTVLITETYGAQVMEREEEIVKALLAERPEEDLQDVWRKNLLMMLKEHKTQSKPTAQKQLLQRMSQ